MCHSDLRYKGIGSIDHFYHNMFDFPYNFGRKEAEFEQEYISQLSLDKTWIPIQGARSRRGGGEELVGKGGLLAKVDLVVLLPVVLLLLLVAHQVGSSSS